MAALAGLFLAVWVMFAESFPPPIPLSPPSSTSIGATNAASLNNLVPIELGGGHPSYEVTDHNPLKALVCALSLIISMFGSSRHTIWLHSAMHCQCSREL